MTTRVEADYADVVDVTGWPIKSNEPRGKRQKAWVEGPDGTQWLRKQPRSSRPYEPAIEVATLKLAQLAGMPAAEARLACWTEQNGTLNRGIVVKKFLTEKQSLTIGSDLLSGDDPDYVVTRHEQHTLDRVYASLRVQSGTDDNRRLCQCFMQMIMFDAWIGNSDRHQENWGIVFGEDQVPSLTPVFDSAACLGSELQDGHVLLDEKQRTNSIIRKYVDRCRSGFGDRRNLILQTAVMKEVMQWPNSTETANSLLESLALLNQSAETRIVLRFSTNDLPPNRQALALILLTERLRWLREEVSHALV